MNEQSWIKSIFEYGPYAVLVFFALWVGPRQSNVFLKCDREDKGARTFTASVAGGCWLITVLMTWFIYTNWSSKTVYTGSFGMPKEGYNIKFVTADPNLYISSESVGSILKWNFAVVADSAKQGTQKGYDFLLTWGKDGKESFRQYKIPLDHLKKGYEYKAAEDDPTLLLYDHDDNSSTPSEPLSLASIAPVPSSWGVAYAQGDADKSNKDKDLIKILTSSNIHLRAHGQKQLAELSEAELTGLLEKHPDMPEIARDRVSEERERRAEKSSP
jgi:hypothetical protein